MKYSCTTIIGLFFVFSRTQDLIDQFLRTFTISRCPSAVISTITGIYFLVIKMFRLHMTIICDVFWKVLVGALMSADKVAIPVTDKYLCGCSFYNCRLATVRVQYRVIVAIILTASDLGA